jgi:hypothetical protein
MLVCAAAVAIKPIAKERPKSSLLNFMCCLLGLKIMTGEKVV